MKKRKSKEVSKHEWHSCIKLFLGFSFTFKMQSCLSFSIYFFHFIPSSSKVERKFWRSCFFSEKALLSFLGSMDDASFFSSESLFLLNVVCLLLYYTINFLLYHSSNRFHENLSSFIFSCYADCWTQTPFRFPAVNVLSITRHDEVIEYSIEVDLEKEFNDKEPWVM